MFSDLDGRDDLANAKLDMLADLVTDAINADGAKQWPFVLIGAVKADKVVRQNVPGVIENQIYGEQ